MPVGSLSSRKRVWTGDESTAEVIDDTAALATPTSPTSLTADCAPLAQQRKHLKRIHIPQPSLRPSNALPATQQPPPTHPTTQPTTNTTTARTHYATTPPTGHIQHQHQQAHSAASHHSSLAGLHSSNDSPPTSSAPTSPPRFLPAPPLAVARVRVSRKRHSADLFSSDDIAEVSGEAGWREEGNKRPNAHSSFTFPTLPTPPHSPHSPVAPAPFFYSDHSNRLSDNNELLRSLHAERVRRKQQQQQQQPLPPLQPQHAAGGVSWSTRQRESNGVQGDYCMMPLYGGGEDMFDGDSSWASSSSRGSSSSTHSSLHSQRQSSSSWPLPLPFSSTGSEMSLAAASMSGDGGDSLHRLHRTNSNDSMRDG